MAKTLTSLSKAIQSKTAIESIAITSSGSTEKAATIVHATAIVADSSAGGNLSAEVHVHVPKRNYPLLEDIKAKRKAEWNIPRQDNEFIGRQTLLKALHEQLLQANSNDGKDIKEAQETTKVLVNALKGLGGIGKSELALNYIRNTTHPYTLKAWFPADNPLVLKQKYFELARELGFVGDKEAEAITYLKLWFKEYSGWLLVFDNTNNYNEIKELLPEGKGKIILTTRFQEWPNTFKSIPVPEMEDKEAIELILSFIFSPKKEICRKEENELDTLIKILGNLPLALVQAGAYIGANDNVTIAKYLELYKQNEALLLQTPAFFEANEKTVAVTWNISLQALAKEATTILSIDLITGCAYVAPDAISRELLLVWMKGAYKLDEVAFNHCLGGLKRYSMLKTEGNFVSIHRLVQTVIRNQQIEKIKQKKLTENEVTIFFPKLTAEWFKSLLQAANQEFKRETQALEDEVRQTNLLPHMQSLLDHSKGWNKELNNELGDIQNGMAIVFSNRGAINLAIEYFELGLKNKETQWGKNHLEVALILNNLGAAYTKSENAKRAKEILERAFEIFNSNPGEGGHIFLYRIITNLGNVYGSLGDAKKQKELLEMALKIFEEYYGNENITVARTLMNLGCAYNLLGDAKHSKEVLERALKIFKMHYGNEHADCASTLMNLGCAYNLLGDAKHSKEVLERALKIFKMHYGEDHIETASVLANLGNTHGFLGDKKQQKELLERALKMFEKHYGKEHITVVRTLVDLANACHESYKEKKELLERALKITERHYNENHIILSKLLTNLGSVYCDLGDAKHSKKILESALKIIEGTFTKNHIFVGQVKMALGITYDSLGDARYAKESLENALKIFETHYGKDHILVVEVLMYLGCITHDSPENIKYAKELLEHALNIIETHHGEEHTWTARVLTGLGSIYCDLGDTKSSKEQLERALKILKIHHDENHILVAKTLVRLSATYGSLGDAKKQKELLECTLKTFEEHYGKDNVQTASVIVGLGYACNLLGDARYAKELLEHALKIFETYYDKNHNMVAQVLTNLANTYWTLGEAERTKELSMRALEIFEKHYGKDHLCIAKTLGNLGNAYGALGKPERKRELLERALKIFEMYYGKNHSEVAKTLMNIGVACNELGDIKCGKDLSERALKIFEKYYDSNHIMIAHISNNLGISYLTLGKAKYAKEILERALKIFEAHYGGTHVEVAKTLINLSATNLMLYNLDVAFFMAQKSYDIFQKNYGKQHPYTIKANLLRLECQKHLPCAHKASTPVIFSSQNSSESSLKQILEKYRIATDKGPVEAEVAFRRAAATGLKGDVEFLHLAVKDINAQDDNPKSKKTALHWATIKGHQDIFDFLVLKGAKVDIKDADGKTAREYLKTLNTTNNITTCVSQTPLFDIHKASTPVIFSSQNSSESNLKQILEKYRIATDKGSVEAEVAFRRAAACGCKKEVEFLLSAVKDVNAQDDNPKNKRTALHWAAIKQHQDIFDFLVSKGAKVDIKDAEGKTAQDYRKMSISNSNK